LLKYYNTLINIKKLERGKIKKRERFHSLLPTVKVDLSYLNCINSYL